jgi:hypothetical protein
MGKSEKKNGKEVGNEGASTKGMALSKFLSTLMASYANDKTNVSRLPDS